MNELYYQLSRAIESGVYKSEAPVMDGSESARETDADTAYLLAVAEDAGFEESDHPRESKGGKGGGQFTKKPETLAKEDSRDVLDPNEMPYEELVRRFEASLPKKEYGERKKDEKEKELEEKYRATHLLLPEDLASRRPSEAERLDSIEASKKDPVLGYFESDEYRKKYGDYDSGLNRMFSDLLDDFEDQVIISDSETAERVWNRTNEIFDEYNDMKKLMQTELGGAIRNEMRIADRKKRLIWELKNIVEKYADTLIR